MGYRLPHQGYEYPILPRVLLPLVLARLLVPLAQILLRYHECPFDALRKPLSLEC
ncbi:hypothetical protein D043_3419 [Vibrio parahaemolyticus EKP-021]|nr:hypothetical protein D043_3419 [Vibrio parahaemolyticus EKP-021]